MTLLFTVREESGLGAHALVSAGSRSARLRIHIDGRLASQLTVGAVGAERWEVEIRGRAAHAGVHPEQGVSATVAASLALAELFQGGWFGKVNQPGGTGTSNVGYFGGADGKSAGDATNVVTDYAHLRGESRSHDPRFVKAITAAYRRAFRAAALKVCDDRGRPARSRFRARLDYSPFRLKDDAPVIRHGIAAATRAGIEPALRVTNGGLDANWLVRQGIPVVTFGAGQNNIHAVGEFVDLSEFLNGCKLALALATTLAD